jgi:hypothetical protein
MGQRRKLHGARFPDKIAKQVCSPALAQQLKALGVPQESLWYWVASSGRTYPLLAAEEDLSAAPLFQAAAVSAFTVGELGELLPSTVEQDGEVLCFRSLKFPRGFAVAYVPTEADRYSGVEMKAATEADARAQLLIYLIENSLYTP